MRYLSEYDLKSQNLKIGVMLLQAYMGRKSEVIRDLNKLGIAIPIDANYKTILNELNKEDIFQVFTAQFFPNIKCNKFNELCDRFAMGKGLHLLNAEEFRLAVGWLKDHGYRNRSLNKRSSRQDQINQILDEVTPAECITALGELTIAKSVRPVQQNGCWVRGTLGIKISTVNRKGSQVEDLIKLFQKVPTNRLAQFADQLGLKKERITWGKQDHPAFRFNLYQLTLVYFSNEKILKAFNNLLALHKIEVDKIEMLWGIVITPFGVFERNYDGEEKLATILLKTIPEMEKEISSADLEGAFSTQSYGILFTQRPYSNS